MTKLTKVQKEVVRKMRENYELLIDRERFGACILRGWTWYDGNNGYYTQHINICKNTFYSLKRKKMIKSKFKNGYLSVYGLTELGKSIVLTDDPEPPSEGGKK